MKKRHFAKSKSVRDISNGLRSATGNLNHLGTQVSSLVGMVKQPALGQYDVLLNSIHERKDIYYSDGYKSHQNRTYGIHTKHRTHSYTRKPGNDPKIRVVCMRYHH